MIRQIRQFMHLGDFLNLSESSYTLIFLPVTGKEILESFLFCMYLGSSTLPSTKLNEYSYGKTLQVLKKSLVYRLISELLFQMFYCALKKKLFRGKLFACLNRWRRRRRRRQQRQHRLWRARTRPLIISLWQHTLAFAKLILSR